MEEAVFYFKCWGLASDKDGNLDYGYIQMAAKGENNTNIKIKKDILEEIKDTYRKVLANMISRNPKELIEVTKEEYIQAVEESEEE